jgi:hypothetical protein
MQFVRSLFRIAALAVFALLVSCAQPVPPARAAYVGDWEADNVRLTITAGGEVHYFRQRGNSRTTIDMPIKAFEGDDFIVGFGPFTTRFKVSKPPHREGNVWKMTVDDVELTRGLTPGDNKA